MNVTSNIDFVIIWVDDSDQEWQSTKRLYLDKNKKYNINNVRYRDWNLLHYWFRAVEKYAPWVRKIHFVTCGHVPSWLNLKHPKLNFVKHTDYIPMEYLPTFSSHPIELNLHRIQGLSEKFVYFNDDTFLIAKTVPEDFFNGNLPCDCAILNPQIASRYGIGTIVNNDLAIISDYFDFMKQFKKNFGKWFNIKYGMLNIRTAILLCWHRYLGFFEPHCPNSYRKETFIELWEKEEKLLSDICSHKFRDDSDVNQYLMRYWQLASGKFAPRNPKKGKYFDINLDREKIVAAIEKKTYKYICINDSTELKDINEAKKILHTVFEKNFPLKSNFEI